MSETYYAGSPPMPQARPAPRHIPKKQGLSAKILFAQDGEDSLRQFPYAISADGSLTVGVSGSSFSFRAFVWDELNGMRDLMNLLNDMGVDLQGWEQLSHIDDVSADGHTLLGYGYNAHGEYSPFLATIPEPGTLALAGVGLAVLGVRRRRD